MVGQGRVGSIEGRAGAQGERSPGPWRPVCGALTRPALPLAPAVPLAPSLPFSLRALWAPSPQPLPENTPHLPFLTHVSVEEENRGGSGLVGADSSRFWKFNHHYHHPPHEQRPRCSCGCWGVGQGGGQGVGHFVEGFGIRPRAGRAEGAQPRSWRQPDGPGPRPAPLPPLLAETRLGEGRPGAALTRMAPPGEHTRHHVCVSVSVCVHAPVLTQERLHLRGGGRFCLKLFLVQTKKNF